MNRGFIGTYFWAESVPADLTLPDALRRLTHHLKGLRAVNVSWDSGLLIPSDAEISRGWSLQEGRAISPILDDTVIENWPWTDCGFEEWYFFSQLPEDVRLSAYCNWLGISVGDWAQLIEVPNGLDLRRQLEETQPVAVLGEGQRLFAISRNRALIHDFAALCGEQPLDSHR